MTQDRDALVFIGRFQPLHKGHEAVIRQALHIAKEVVVVVGSSFKSRNIRNPFTFEERKAMIEAVFPDETASMYNTFGTLQQGPRLHIVPVSDFPYDDNKWVSAIQKVVDAAVPTAKDVGLIGHSKDHTSYYLNIFPRWKKHVEVENINNINATDIRKVFFEEGYDRLSVPGEANKLNTTTRTIMRKFQASEEFNRLLQEYRMIQKYKESWKAAPFPPTFVTVDAVVVQSGHLLLVKRGAMPGQGLWALPGGFLDQSETLLEGALRELKEETKIKVPLPVLRGSIKESKTFDSPSRSERGRTITTAFYIDLGTGELPKIKGSRILTDLDDDAEEAKWVPFCDIDQETLYEDHYAIIDYFLNIG